MDALAYKLLPPEAFEEVRLAVDKYFAEKRMQRFMKAEEQQAALRHEDASTEEVL
jgi:hypothetical protein